MQFVVETSQFGSSVSPLNDSNVSHKLPWQPLAAVAFAMPAAPSLPLPAAEVATLPAPPLVAAVVPALPLAAAVLLLVAAGPLPALPVPPLPAWVVLVLAARLPALVLLFAGEPALPVGVEAFAPAPALELAGALPAATPADAEAGCSAFDSGLGAELQAIELATTSEHVWTMKIRRESCIGTSASDCAASHHDHRG